MHASAFGHASGMPNRMLNPASCQALCVCLQYSRLAGFKVGVTLPKCLLNGRKPVYRHSCQTCIVKTYCYSTDLPVPVQQAKAATISCAAQTATVLLCFARETMSWPTLKPMAFQKVYLDGRMILSHHFMSLSQQVGVGSGSG